MKKLILTILFCLMMGNWAWAATAFNVSVAPSGGDYSTLEGIFNAAGTIDLTSAATKVFTITGGITGTMSDNTAVTGATSGATGTCVHASSTQILIKSITGTFQSGEIVYETLGTNYVTLGNAGASPTLVITISGSWSSPDTTAVTIGAITKSSTNNLIITATGTARTNGIPGKTGGYILAPASGAPMTFSDSTDSGNVTVDGFQIISSATNKAPIWFAIAYASSMTFSNLILIPSSTDHAIIYSLITEGNWYIYNCVAYGLNSEYGDFLGYSYSNSSNFGSIYFYNNTLYNFNGSTYTDGITSSGGTFIASNNAVMSVTQKCFSGTFTSGATNASSDTTATTSPLTGGIDNLTSYTSYFVSPSTNNFTLKAGSPLIGAGTNLSGTFTTDITGATRQASGAWDIGAFYYASSTPTNHGFTRFL